MDHGRSAARPGHCAALFGSRLHAGSVGNARRLVGGGRHRHDGSAGHMVHTPYSRNHHLGIAMFFWLSCLAAGLSLYLLVWVFTRPLLLHKEQMRRMPGRLLLHLSWPWVLALAPVCQPFISWRMRLALSQRVLTAGVGRWCLPEHIVAMQFMGFLALLLASVLVLQTSGDARLAHILLPCLGAGLIGMLWPRYWLHGLARQRQFQMLREFPFLLDMTTLCVEAGLHLHGALQQAGQHGPDGPLRGELRHALADMRAGVPRIQGTGRA